MDEHDPRFHPSHTPSPLITDQACKPCDNGKFVCTAQGDHLSCLHIDNACINTKTTQLTVINVLYMHILAYIT